MYFVQFVDCILHAAVEQWNDFPLHDTLLLTDSEEMKNKWLFEIYGLTM